MICIEVFDAIVSELLDEFPEEFFRKLSGGVVVSEETMLSDWSADGNVYTVGQYRFFSGVRQIAVYKGSFDRVYPQTDVAEAREILRGILRHEFRHHLEYLAGITGADSLAAEDERKRRAYLAERHIPQDMETKPSQE